MPISRSQMERQLRMGGGIMGLEPRQEYGLGSIVKSVKKAVSGAAKGIKSFAKSDLGKAALLIGGGMYAGGLGPFSSMKGAGFLSNLSMPSFISNIGKGDGFLKGITGGKAGLGIMAASALSGLFAGKSQEEIQAIQQDPTALRSYLTQYFTNLNQDKNPAQINELVEANMVEYRANGGRIGYADGSKDMILPMRKPEIEQMMFSNPGAAESGNPITRNNPVADLIDKYNTYKKAMPGVADETKTYLIEDFKQSLENSGISIEEFNMRLQEQNEMDQPIEKAYGGRINRAYGSDDLVEQASGIEGLDINVNPQGVKELDLRDSGGFIPPVGVKEKADDIPAMLSNNEFVFTADAVRGMGNGNVNTGAQRMYDMMKKLENGGRV